ncbi:MAG: hypothetical protein PHR00_02565 [Patescibacteria group bacterium]|nr:hypothetical protein [Patescibacteria group bacterium]
MSNSGRRVTHASGTGYGLRGGYPSKQSTKGFSNPVCPICHRKIGPQEKDQIELFDKVYHLNELAGIDQLVKPDRKLMLFFEKKYQELTELGSKGSLNGEQKDYDALVKLFQTIEYYTKIKKDRQENKV